MSRTFLTADLHIGHANTPRFRPFHSSAEHDSIIINTILETVKKRDTLWILGDGFFTLDSMVALKLLCQNIGQIKFILGNHDLSLYQWLHNWEFSNLYVAGVGEKWDSWLTHIPVHPSELEDRKRYNIHGHLHEQRLIDSRYFCVSLEQNRYKPFLLDDVLERLHDSN